MKLKEAEKLLVEFEDHRNAIKDMISELNDIKKNIDRLIPTSLDARYIRFFEEKVKSITNLFNSLLEMRKEITKSVREEIDLRRKLEDEDGDQDLESRIDIRRVAERVETFKKEQEKFKEKLKKHNIEDYEGIEIPGVNTTIK